MGEIVVYLPWQAIEQMCVRHILFEESHWIPYMNCHVQRIELNQNNATVHVTSLSETSSQKNKNYNIFFFPETI